MDPPIAGLLPRNLAKMPRFRLGDVEVDPATRRIRRGDRCETLEPRVMLVLVALAEANGAVLSRDALIERCWQGRIVGENAINRVMSRIRQLAADLGVDSFQLETITKVGYRMLVHGQPDPHETGTAPPVALPPPGVAAARPSRRMLLAGTAAGIAVAGGGTAAWLLTRGHRPNAAALELYRRGEIAQRLGTPDQVQQAVAFFKQAVEADPRYAGAWGALALAYRHILEGFGEAEADSLPGLIRSAAERALDLDPDNADALLALVIVKPYFRNWQTMEAELRGLAARFPGHWLVHAQLGLLLQDVGRIEEGVAQAKRVIEIDPFLPVTHAYLARGLSCARRIQETDSVLEQALRRWPRHPMIWRVRFNTLMYSGRPAAAAAFVTDPERKPAGLPPADIEELRLLARAAERRDPGDVAASVAGLRRHAMEWVEETSAISPMLALLGREDLAFAALERYYLGTGTFGSPTAPPDPYARRYALVLFSPTLAPLRRDPRHRALVARIGLADYWRATGTAPDVDRA